VTVAYIGLGSNLGDRLGYLQAALAALSARGLEPAGVSSVYESDALGPPQPNPQYARSTTWREEG